MSTAETPARVTLLPSGQSLSVAPEETILDAALRSGMNLPHSCKGGHCSSCRARILTGEVRYPLGRPLGLLETEERAGFVLLCQAHAASHNLTIEIREIRAPVEMQVKNLPCRIERLQPLTPNVTAVFLRLPAAERFDFLAGQYIDIMLSQNRRRSFSLANPPHAEALLELHVRRVAGGEFTQQVFDASRAGALLRMEGPFGQFWFREASPRPALLIGGGTGYAPLRAILRHLLERHDTRPLHLYWGAQSLIELYEHTLLLGWCSTYANFRYTPVLLTPQPQDHWRGRTGWVHTAALQDHAQIAAYDVYTSGPPAMVEAVRHQFIAHGLPVHQLFFDSFDFAPDVQAKLPPNTGPEL